VIAAVLDEAARSAEAAARPAASRQDERPPEADSAVQGEPARESERLGARGATRV